MRSRLSYYSILLLVGLAVGSVLMISINPFNGAPASASPGSAVTTSSQTAQPPLSNVAPSGQSGGAGSQPQGTLGSHHHDDGGYFDGAQPGSSAATTTTTTTSAASIYSQDE